MGLRCVSCYGVKMFFHLSEYQIIQASCDQSHHRLVESSGCVLVWK